MNNTQDLMVVTNYDKVDPEEFYLNDKEWGEHFGPEAQKEARALAKNGQLYYAYIVPTKSYALYCQMDADEIYIDQDGNEIMHAQTSVISNDFSDKWEYED